MLLKKKTDNYLLSHFEDDSEWRTYVKEQISESTKIPWLRCHLGEYLSFVGCSQSDYDCCGFDMCFDGTGISCIYPKRCFCCHKKGYCRNEAKKQNMVKIPYADIIGQPGSPEPSCIFVDRTRESDSDDGYHLSDRIKGGCQRLKIAGEDNMAV